MDLLSPRSVQDRIKDSMNLLQPRSLQVLCLNLLAEKPDILWSQNDGNLFSEPAGVEWRDPKLFLHNQFADTLLDILSHNGTLKDGVLSTFTQEHVCLKNVKISDCRLITERGLQVLSHHKLVSLDIECVNICTVLKCIGNKSYESLQHLVIQNHRFCELWPSDDLSVVETLFRFNCLKHADFSSTNLTNTMLTILGKSLLHVENLNLSRNIKITDISPLENCQMTLKSLSLCELHDITAQSAMATFVTLTGLTYLDVSLLTGGVTLNNPVSFPNSLTPEKTVFTADMLLQMPDVLPNLVFLDLSGRTVRSKRALSQFLDAHQSLQTLMLWGTAACQFKSLQDYRPQLTVGGDATLEQYAAVLRHWTRIGAQGIHFYTNKQRLAMNMLNKAVNANQFPPCDNDHLVQVMLGTLPTRSITIHAKNLWEQLFFLLHIISVLLDKGIIRHLEPDTKQHLLWFCYRALQERPKSRSQLNVSLPAAKVLRALP